MIKVIGNISITNLAQLENLSKRSINVCKENNLNDLDSILKFYRKYGNFRKLRSCGTLTDQQLTRICKKYIALIIPASTDHQKKHYNSFLINIDSLSIKQKNILNVLIKYLFENLSFKSSKTLTFHLGPVNIDTIRSHNLDNSSELRNYRYVGKITLAEIDQFISNIKIIIENITQIENLDEIGIQIIKKISKDKLLLNSALNAEIDWDDNQKIQPDPFLISIDSLTTKQKNILNVQINKLVKGLSFKSSNTLTIHLESINIDSIRSHNLNNSSELSNYRYVGKVTLAEIDKFISNIKTLIDQINEYENFV